MLRKIILTFATLTITASAQTEQAIEMIYPTAGAAFNLYDTILIRWTGYVVNSENLRTALYLSVDGGKTYPHFLAICSGGYDTAFYKYALTPRIGMEKIDSLVSNNCRILAQYYISGQIDFILGGDTSEVFSILPATTAARRPAAITNRTSIVPTTTSSFTLSGRLLPACTASSVRLRDHGFIRLR
ncbi:MAG: hypothetical protein GX556_16455 [Fibrobacter sp.]|nr:hypothetical protein [Fibrobacter sp.]